MSEEKLKPCPFCGSSDLLIARGQWWHVRCVTCLAQISDASKRDTIRGWNTRTAPAEPGEEK